MQDNSRSLSGNALVADITKKLEIAMKSLIVVTKEREQLRVDVQALNRRMEDMKEDARTERADLLVSLSFQPLSINVIVD